MVIYVYEFKSSFIDELCNKYILEHPNATIIHLGCGLDSRNLRVHINNLWYDIDFKDVIDERKIYFNETEIIRKLLEDKARF